VLIDHYVSHHSNDQQIWHQKQVESHSDQSYITLSEDRVTNSLANFQVLAFCTLQPHMDDFPDGTLPRKE
jgi:hypothetical protein